MSNSNDYWAKRKAQRMWEYMEESEKQAREIAKYYGKVSNYLNHEIGHIFNRYQTKYKLSKQDAINVLNKVQDKNSINELINKLRLTEDSDEKRELIKLLESPAYAARIRRFQEMQNEIDLMMRKVYEQEKEMNTKNYVNIGKESYYKSIFEIQQMAGLGFTFSTLDYSMFDKMLNSRWSGENYSSRIWSNTQAVANAVKEEMIIGLLTGKTEREMAERITKQFQVGAFKARRLIRTEVLM